MTEIDWSFLAGINLLQVAIVILAVYVTIRLLVRFWPWLRKVMELTSALAQLPAFIQRTDRTLAEQSKTLTAQDVKIADIHHEVHYNNGSSVKDAVDRVERGVKGIYDRLDVADARFDAADKDRRELREDLEQTRPHAPARKRAPKPKEQE